MMDIKRLFGENLRRLRKNAGLSQEEVAGRMSVEQAYLSRLESGEKNPTIETVALIADALGVAPADLFAENRRSATRTRSSR